MDDSSGTRLRRAGSIPACALPSLILAVVVAAAFAVPCRAVEPGVPNSFNAVHSQAKAEAVLELPVALQAAVAYFGKSNILVGLLLAAVVLVGVRSWAVERRMRSQTAALGYIEHRRSRILEDINGSRPLAEIIEQITELVAFKLRGAPCWCQIADGARLGNYPPNPTPFRIAQEQIAARSGPPLGTIYAALDPAAKPQEDEAQTLFMAAALATLAIETRRLYSDLRHRSEHDLLTDIHNRFALNKHLDALIDEARETAGIFGLIYIDLDEFKRVNDLYGHHVGDLYLQQVSQRMKRQLRGGDMLARLGGDEFVALVMAGHTREGVEEIALRLASSFNEPVAVEGYVLQGSASVGIAIYPEDGTTKEKLFTAADTDMYLNKHTRRESALASAHHHSASADSA
ncbi:MAG: GGDEF domain-containing protein [Terracidiphilus sp.]|jgi:diguanylate cyclase (GGDEF)-like protein